MAGGQERDPAPPDPQRAVHAGRSPRRWSSSPPRRSSRAQSRIAANRPYREGMERILRLTAAADPHGRSQAARDARGAASRGHPGHRRATGAWRGPTTPACCAPPSAWSPSTGPHGAEVTLWSVGKKAPAYFRYRGIETAAVVRRRSPTARVRRRARHRRGRGGALRRRGDRPGRSWSRPASSRPAPSGSRRMQMLPLPLPEPEPSPRMSTSRRGHTGRGLHRVRARRREAARRAGAACARGGDLRRAARRRGVVLHRPAARHGRRHRERDELVRTLTRVMNRARQDAITTEIMEIVGGAEALRQAKGA